jgi:hypothetical protein
MRPADSHMAVHLFDYRAEFYEDEDEYEGGARTGERWKEGRRRGEQW